MCAEDLKTSSPALKRMGLPIVFGVTIEIACDLLKHVVRYFRTSIYFDVGHGLWRELTDADIWIGLGFAILLVVLSIWVLDAWKWADPRRPVRTGLLLISVILAGIFNPLEYVFRDSLLRGFDKAEKGQSMDAVLHGFEYGDPLVEPHRESGNPADCSGNCWFRISYELPVVLGEHWIRLEFDRDQHLISKERL